MTVRPVSRRAARVRSSTWDADERTLEVVWSTGAAVNRLDWDGEFVEVLSMEPGAVRLGRLNAGAPMLDTHDDSGIGRVIGSVVPGSAFVADGKGHATVRLSAASDCADAVLKIVEGSVRNVSVGYWTHSQTETEAGGIRTITATDWEPLEISAVPIPADAGAQFRSVRGGPMRRAVDTVAAQFAAGAAAARALLKPAGKPDAERQRGAAAARSTLKTVKGSTAADAIARGRREARRADGRRVDDALASEAGRRAAEALLGKGRR